MLNELAAGITKRKIQIALGCLWLLDGALQLQPQMFTNNFANQVLAPTATGQPAFVHGPMEFVIRLILHQPALFNTCFILIQLGIGILILKKSTARYGLAASVVWGLAVWYLGEGLGGLFAGQAMLLTGAPGAALLYAAIALAVLPAGNKHDAKNDTPAGWLQYIWLVLWLGGSVLLLSSSQLMTGMVAAMVRDMAGGAPGWLASIDSHFAQWVGGLGAWFLLLMAAIYMAVGFMGMLSRRWRALGVGLGILLALAFWVAGQNFGGFYSGLATDPGTAPLIILLGIAVLGTPESKLDLLGNA